MPTRKSRTRRSSLTLEKITMDLVVDQNCFRAPELQSHLAASPDNRAVVTDMAVFEMLKGKDPMLTAEKSLTILSDYPDQVRCTAGTGDLMRMELTQKTSVVSPLDDELTKRMQVLLREIARFLKGERKSFPLDEAHITRERAIALLQRSDHDFHKGTLNGGVDVLRKRITPELQKQIRSGSLTKEVYEFAYQTGYIAFKNSVSKFDLSEEDIKRLYLDYCLTARNTIVYILSCMRWFEVGGAESMAAADITNDLHDVDYVVISSYFDGILSKEKRVNLLYRRMRDFFEGNRKQ